MLKCHFHFISHRNFFLLLLHCQLLDSLPVVNQQVTGLLIQILLPGLENSNQVSPAFIVLVYGLQFSLNRFIIPLLPGQPHLHNLFFILNMNLQLPSPPLNNFGYYFHFRDVYAPAYPICSPCFCSCSAKNSLYSSCSNASCSSRLSSMTAPTVRPITAPRLDAACWASCWRLRSSGSSDSASATLPSAAAPRRPRLTAPPKGWRSMPPVSRSAAPNAGRYPA